MENGFLLCAMHAQVPIVLSALDYGRKAVRVGPYFIPTGDYDKDMEFVREFYSDVKAKHPHKFSLPPRLSEGIGESLHP